MFFVLSKLFWFLVAPSHLMAILLMAATLSLLLRWKRAAILLGGLGMTILFIAGVTPLPVLAMRSIENSYGRPSWPPHVDGILILGSGFDTALLHLRHAPQANGGVYRLVEGLAAARHYPGALVVFSGGSGALEGAKYSEAGTAQYVLTELGLEPKRLLLEARSRNTYENLVFSKALVKPKAGQVWLLATSAAHMPRAMAIAEQVGWPMVAWPTDYMTAPDSQGGWLFVTANLGLADYAVHEWVGMIAYRFTGKAA